MNPLTSSLVHRILVIDDNASIHEDFRKILGRGENTGEAGLATAEAVLFAEKPAVGPAGSAIFQMDSAFQGEPGLRMVRAAAAEGRPYELAFVDVRMPPGWDGIETIARIWQEFPETQVIICTAYSDYSWEEILSQLGERDSLVILKKPFDNVEVLQLALALTKKWRLTRQANARMADLDEMVRQRTEELLQTNQKLQAEIQRRAVIEAALRNSEERFHKAFEVSSVALAILRAGDQRYLDVNESFARLVGHLKTQILGHTARELDLLEQPDQCQDFIRTVQTGGKVQNVALGIRHKNGDTRHSLVSVELINLGGEPCILAALLDVTEQRQLESQLRQAQKMEAIGQLAAGIAHDFNNLLTVIQGHACTQLAKASLDQDIANSFEQVRLASERAATLTRQLLTFSRKQAVQRKPLDLNATVGRLQKMFSRLLGETIGLECTLAGDLPAVVADEPSLDQVLMNLAVNARDAMPQGGRLHISTTFTEFATPSTERHPDARAGRFVVLTVSDNGCGMDETTQARIFEPFFTTKPLGQGTGLGLATVYGIVKQHEGWIEIESNPGQGTTFRVVLPASDPARAATAAMPPVGSASSLRGTGETILVVEDEPAVRKIVVRALAKNGYQILEADSGNAALVAWQSAAQKIHLLFTDMIMPNGLSGSELAAELLKRDGQLKVVYASGYSPDLVASGQPLEEGINFLPKPYSPERLLKTVRRALDAKPATGGPPAGSVD